MNNFTDRIPQEISLAEIERIPNYNSGLLFPKNLEVKIHVNYTIQDILDELKEEKLNVLNPGSRIMDIKARSIESVAVYLYHLGKYLTQDERISKFKIMYKDLYPGDTMIVYDMWLEFK